MAPPSPPGDALLHSTFSLANTADHDAINMGATGVSSVIAHANNVKTLDHEGAQGQTADSGGHTIPVDTYGGNSFSDVSTAGPHTDAAALARATGVSSVIARAMDTADNLPTSHVNIPLNNATDHHQTQD